jgi:arylsulfatase A-like enzyme
MTGIRTCAVCAALLLAGFACGASPAEPPNIVLIIVDDVGVELFGAYNRDRLEVKGASIPPEHRVMPNIDALAERGLLFRNAWSAPLCGPTRLSLFTGSYGLHSGAIFKILRADRTAPPGLPTLAERLRDAAYGERMAVGKWHLSRYEPYSRLDTSPTTLGFSRYAGTAGIKPYVGYAWATDPLPPDRVLEFPTEYVTTKEVSEAVTFVEEPHEGPWLLWLALHAAHSPWDEAETPSLESSACNTIADAPRRVRCRQLEIADEALGDLVAALEAADPGLERTTVILFGDNGSPRPFKGRAQGVPGRVNRDGKGTLYEGGINVPLIVAGAGVAAGDAAGIQETEALVHAVDVFATVLDLAGVDSPEAGIDGRSFADALAGGAGPRRCVYADGIRAGDGKPERHAAHHDVAIRDARHKLIRRAKRGGRHLVEFYDLALDPAEKEPLAASGPEFEALLAELERVDRDAAASPCDPARGAG